MVSLWQPYESNTKEVEANVILHLSNKERNQSQGQYVSQKRNAKNDFRVMISKLLKSCQEAIYLNGESRGIHKWERWRKNYTSLKQKEKKA